MKISVDTELFTFEFYVVRVAITQTHEVSAKFQENNPGCLICDQACE
jgi:hypothetical protein